jgi:hypothetical protein
MSRRAAPPTRRQSFRPAVRRSHAPARRRTLAVGAVVAAALLAGCGSSSTTTSPTTAQVETTEPPTTFATATTIAGAPATTVAPAGIGRPLFVSGAVPPVSGATDLKKEPHIGTTTAPKPARLTGKDLVVGTGAIAGPADTVKVQYVGALYPSGKVFDASWTDSGPATFSLDQVVAGFKDGIIGMRIGGRREIVIPPSLGYGASVQGPIPANSTLTFVIDLLALN